MKAVFPILLIGGCLAPPVEKPPVTTVGEIPVDVVLQRQQNVDILFMVDDSSSMALPTTSASSPPISAPATPPTARSTTVGASISTTVPI